MLAAVEVEVHKLVAPVDAHPTWQVRRLDLARAYTINPVDQRALLTGWTRVPSKASSKGLYANSKGVPGSITVGTKTRGKVIAYDHHAKHATSPANTFRVEVQARQAWCNNYGGIETIADISPSACTDLYENRVAWAGLNTPVLQHHDRVRRLHDHAVDPDTDLTVRQLPGVLGREVLLEAGIDPHEGNSTQSRRRARTLVTGVAHIEPDGPTALHLDPHHDEPIYGVAA